MQFRRQVHTEESINVTPLIDVVFLLLIFFMVSTTFTKETHLPINLPEASVEEQVIAARGIDIVVTAAGEYRINGRALINKQRQTLMRALTEIANGNVQQPLLITADANASHQSVVTVMEVVGKLGFKQLHITTKESAESQ